MKPLSTRTGNFEESVIWRMARTSRRHGAVNLMQGFPDFDPPKVLRDALVAVAAEGPHQYAVTWGSQEFREALAVKQSHFMGMDINANTQIVVTCGSTEAMMCAMMSVVDPGDRVIVFTPFYEIHKADAILCGAEPVYVPLTAPDFTLDADRLEAAFRTGAKALILCNPSNPSGKVFSRAELETIAELAKKYDAYVITDEVYEHIVYTPFVHTYIASLPGMTERTISCSSLSKTYSITGWRIGYVIASPEITAVVKKVHDFLTVGASAPLQAAAIAGLKMSDLYYQSLVGVYAAKRKLFLDGLDRLGIVHTNPQGAYYVMIDIGEYGYESDLRFCEDLAEKVGVGAIPGSSFFREPINNLIRLHFAKREETLVEALNRLETMQSKMKK